MVWNWQVFWYRQHPADSGVHADTTTPIRGKKNAPPGASEAVSGPRHPAPWGPTCQRQSVKPRSLPVQGDWVPAPGHGGDGVGGVGAGACAWLQLVGEIVLVVHQGVIVCIRESARHFRAVLRALHSHLLPLWDRGRGIHACGGQPHAQEKVKNQNRNEAP